MFVLVFCLGAIFSSHADLDYSVSAIARTTPIASQVDGTLGYGQRLWGDETTPFYGYIRPSTSLRGSTSPAGVVNLDIYPVSFFGMSVGRIYMHRYVDQPEINCELAECKGWFNNSYIQAKLLGKYQKFFGTLTFQKDFYDSHDSSVRPVYQAVNVVFISPNKDQGEDWFAVLGYEINPQWSVGVIAEEFSSQKLNHHQDMQLAFVKWTREEWSYTVGAGRFQSTPLGAGPELTINAVWTGKKKIGF